MLRLRRPPRRRCAEPRAGQRCRPAASRQGEEILDTRIRGVCRRREDFTGRGFGRERRRQAR